jgi:hypothetical protein
MLLVVEEKRIFREGRVGSCPTAMRNYGTSSRFFGIHNF